MKKQATPKEAPSTVEAVVPQPALQQAEQLRALDPDWKKVEALIRKLQAKVAAINTDAAYEIKRAADYFLMDAKDGVGDVVRLLTTQPDYQPDAESAAIIRGEQEDFPLILLEQLYGAKPKKPKKARGERRLQSVESEIVVAGEPVAPRSQNIENQ